MSMQKVKGSILKSRLAFVDKQFGPEGLDRVMENLDPEDQKALRGLVPVAWLDFEIGRRLDDAIVKVLGGGRPEVFERLGAASADANLTTVHSAFIAHGDPQAFLAKAPQIYRMYYQTGRREYEPTGEMEGVLTTYDAETFSKADCRLVQARARALWRQESAHRRGFVPCPRRRGVPLPRQLAITSRSRVKGKELSRPLPPGLLRRFTLYS